MTTFKQALELYGVRQPESLASIDLFSEDEQYRLTPQALLVRAQTVFDRLSGRWIVPRVEAQSVSASIIRFGSVGEVHMDKTAFDHDITRRHAADYGWSCGLFEASLRRLLIRLAEYGLPDHEVRRHIPTDTGEDLWR